jgi:hypothetical protein
MINSQAKHAQLIANSDQLSNALRNAFITLESVEQASGLIHC